MSLEKFGIHDVFERAENEGEISDTLVGRPYIVNGEIHKEISPILI